MVWEPHTLPGSFPSIKHAHMTVSIYMERMLPLWDVSFIIHFLLLVPKIYMYSAGAYFVFFLGVYLSC